MMTKITIRSETIRLADTTPFDLIQVEGGAFMMGDDHSKFDDEKPSHKVRLPTYWMGKYPVTQELWYAVMKGTELENSSSFKGPKRPVERVSWDDITKEFLPRLNDKTGREFRLPTEAEWEYAARGGNLSKGYVYAGSNKLKEVGWYELNSHEETKPVGLKAPNEIGLHDMSGNVREWCQDCWNDSYTGAPTDGSAWLKGNCNLRVRRGGSWLINDDLCRVANRNRNNTNNRNNNNGFRLARN